MRWSAVISVLLLLAACAGPHVDAGPESSCRYARNFDIIDVTLPSGEVCSAVVVISPFGGNRDTLVADAPMDNIICMSSSHVAALSEIGADSVISAVSGMAYISDPDIRQRFDAHDDPHPVYDIGYESSLDYEKILELDPDLLVAYTVSGVVPPYIAKLRNLGIPVVILHDHLEEHPLARAEYVRLFGALTHRLAEADSIYAEVCSRYEALAEAIADAGTAPCDVLLNIPYADAWYIPGEESYMSRIIQDAGGRVLGAEPGTPVSSVISIETAYRLSQQARIWLNPGSCRTLEELGGVHQLFPKFGPLAKGLPVYNNTLRTTPEGGNDFWESGAMRPDLILQDLAGIFTENTDASLHYFFSLD